MGRSVNKKFVCYSTLTICFIALCCFFCVSFLREKSKENNSITPLQQEHFLDVAIRHIIIQDFHADNISLLSALAKIENATNESLNVADRNIKFTCNSELLGEKKILIVAKIINIKTLIDLICMQTGANCVLDHEASEVKFLINADTIDFSQEVQNEPHTLPPP